MIFLNSKDKIKEILLSDTDKLVFVLERLGCHKINPEFGLNELRCALPDGDNATSVSIFLQEYMPCYVFSRGTYDQYDVKDIITLVQYINKMTFTQALDWLCQTLNIENEFKSCDYETLNVVADIRKKKQKGSKTNKITHTVLDKSILNQYENTVSQKWVDEGIAKEIQVKYGVRNDTRSKRWIIPIFDEDDNLISLKARTYAKDYEKMGLSKYIYYYKLNGNDILFGLNINKKKILEKSEIILVEGEKSVMKLDAYGYDWSCSVGTNGINKHLVKKILELKCRNIVLAFDKDVSRASVYKEARKLSRYANVYVIIDNENLLGDKKLKNSPCDISKEVWEKLYEQKERVWGN